MRLITCVLILSAVGCAKAPAGEPKVCAAYASPYLVEYPGGTLRKSDIEACGDTYRATALDQSGATIESSNLTIQLLDDTTGAPYSTQFAGQ